MRNGDVNGCNGGEEKDEEPVYNVVFCSNKDVLKHIYVEGSIKHKKAKEKEKAAANPYVPSSYSTPQHKRVLDLRETPPSKHSARNSPRLSSRSHSQHLEVLEDIEESEDEYHAPLKPKALFSEDNENELNRPSLTMSSPRHRQGKMLKKATESANKNSPSRSTTPSKASDCSTPTSKSVTPRSSKKIEARTPYAQRQNIKKNLARFMNEAESDSGWEESSSEEESDSELSDEGPPPTPEVTPKRRRGRPFSNVAETTPKSGKHSQAPSPSHSETTPKRGPGRPFSNASETTPKSGKHSRAPSPSHSETTPKRGPGRPFSNASETTPKSGKHSRAPSPSHSETTPKRGPGRPFSIVSETTPKSGKHSRAPSPSNSETTPKRGRGRPPVNVAETTPKKGGEQASEVPSPAPSMTTRTRPRAAKEQTTYTPDDFFTSQASSKVATSDHTLSRLQNPRLGHEVMQDVLKRIQPKHKQEVERLLSIYGERFGRWMSLLSEGYNLLLHGLGSKATILNDFYGKMLADDWDVIIINGFFATLTLKDILRTIAEDFLDLSPVPGDELECCELIVTAYSAEDAEPLYLLLNNLDGPLLQGEKTQAILARLAAVPSIRLVATIDHVNAPLLFDQSLLVRLNLVWQEVSTFLPYSEETSFENSLMVQQSGGLALAALRSVFQSLTSNARDIFLILVSRQMASEDPKYPGMLFRDLYRESREGFLVSSDLALRSQLTEFLDHQLVRMKRSNDGEYLFIPIPLKTLKEFTEMQEE